MSDASKKDPMTAPDVPAKSEFEKLSEQQRELTLVGEFWEFVRENKKWWLIPILCVFLLLGALVFLSGTAAAPFIYTLF
jgi:hypothetical protein